MPVDVLVREAEGLPENLIMNVVSYMRFLKSMAGKDDERRVVAAEYYRQHAASVGRCAQMAEMSEEDFITYLGERGLSIFQYEDESEFLEDVKNA